MNICARALNVIEEPVIRVELSSGARERSTLPRVLATLAADRVETFPSLRPHQAPAWHAFLVRIAAMGLEALGWTEPPGDDEAGWSEVVRALTPDRPADELWCLVTPPQCPALLQAPVPETALRKYEKEFKYRVLAPDALACANIGLPGDCNQAVAACDLPASGAALGPTRHVSEPHDFP